MSGQIELGKTDLIDALALPSGRTVLQGGLPEFLKKRRWFSRKDRGIENARIKYVARLGYSEREVLITEIEVISDGTAQNWLLPLATMMDGEEANTASRLSLVSAKKGQRTGFIADAATLPDFARGMVSSLAHGARVKISDGEIRFEPREGCRDELLRSLSGAVTCSSAEQSNSSVIVGDAVMLKIFRKISAGTHPEAEMSRFLTGQGFKNSPALLGEVDRTTDAGERSSLAVVQAFVPNNGDAWSWTLDQLGNALAAFASNDLRNQSVGRQCVEVAARIGRRLGEMHELLARPASCASFIPEIGDEENAASWLARAQTTVDHAFALIEKQAAADGEAQFSDAKLLLEKRDVLSAKLLRASRKRVGAQMTRVHGDFHLGQVLIVPGDVYIR
jgi:maltose alpha-D-glucosyltransferase / alpha-amylase